MVRERVCRRRSIEGKEQREERGRGGNRSEGTRGNTIDNRDSLGFEDMNCTESILDSEKLDVHVDEQSITCAPTISPEAEDEEDSSEDDNVEEDADNLEAPRRLSESGITFFDSLTPTKRHNCTADWSKERKMLAVFGCVSSILVRIIRLKLDPGYRTYTIHSVVVFFDMVLIHIFTATRWLSVSGESIVIASMLLYHYTKQKVWELLETTLLAMICSFHMILSRSEHMDREEELEGLIGLEIIAHDDGNVKVRRRSVTVDKQALVEEEQRDTSSPDSVNTNATALYANSASKEKRRQLKTFSQHFFEHFLDGSAGVMYTSFLGLIIDEFIIWGLNEKE